MGNWQAYSGDTPLHPTQRNSSHKHPLVKWCWLWSWTSRDPCFWTLYHVMAQSLWSLQRLFTNIKNKYLGRLNYPVTQQCPSWWPIRHTQLEVPNHSAYILAYHYSFHVSELLKKTLKDHTFTWNDDMQEAVVEAAGQGILYRVCMRAFVSVGFLSKCVWWFFLNIAYLHLGLSEMGFSSTCLIFHKLVTHIILNLPVKA